MDQYDVVVVGAGTAGLSAALSLGRAMRKTLVLDGGAPRNAVAGHAHNLFTRDGTPPDELLRLGRKDLEKYDTIEVREGRATEASGEDGDFTVEIEGGETIFTRKVLLAGGVVDVMPDVPGYAEAWGRGIHHCPFCHGWELRGRPLAVYGDGEAAIHRVDLIRNWSRDLIYITEGQKVSEENGKKLDALGIPYYEGPIAKIESDADAGVLTGITLKDGTHIEREAIFTGPEQRQGSGLAEMLGCEISYFEMMRTHTVTADPMTRETTVKGVSVAGDAAVPPAQSLPNSVATGSNAGAFLAHTLSAEDAAAEIAANSERV